MRTGRLERVRPRPVQRSAKWLNRTQGPVRRSQYFLLNRTEPDFRITRTDATVIPENSPTQVHLGWTSLALDTRMHHRDPPSRLSVWLLWIPIVHQQTRDILCRLVHKPVQASQTYKKVPPIQACTGLYRQALFVQIYKFLLTKEMSLTLSDHLTWLESCDQFLTL